MKKYNVNKSVLDSLYVKELEPSDLLLRGGVARGTIKILGCLVALASVALIAKFLIYDKGYLDPLLNWYGGVPGPHEKPDGKTTYKRVYFESLAKGDEVKAGYVSKEIPKNIFTKYGNDITYVQTEAFVGWDDKLYKKGTRTSYNPPRVEMKPYPGFEEKTVQEINMEMEQELARLASLS